MTTFLPILFWLIMVFWLIAGWGWWWPRSPPAARPDNLVLWVLLAILGWYAIGLPK